MWDIFWHKWLRRPYQLVRTVDQGSGPSTVVLLHGIGRSGAVWQHVVSQFAGLPYRVVAFDLLGFGESPKPEWCEYSATDHARAVLASIKRLNASGPIIIVGHSMGCLVAVRAARLQPGLARHMVLYEMPLYEGLPQKRIYRLRLSMYFRLYDNLIRYQPDFDRENARFAERLAARITGFEVTRSSWQPFVKSLRNTIVRQTTARDIKQLTMPIDVIYGLFDMLVIRGKPQLTFGSDSFITAHTVRARHEISPKASRFIVERVEAAQHPERVKSAKAKRVLRRAKRTR